MENNFIVKTTFVCSLFFFFLLVSSCTYQNPKPADNILHVDIADDSITSIRTYIMYGYIPSDSTASFFINVDANLSNDISLSIRRENHWVGPAIYGHNDNYFISCSVLNNSGGFACVGGVTGCCESNAKVFSYGDVINTTSSFNSLADPYVDSHFYSSQYGSNSGNQYLGFKISGCFGWVLIYSNNYRTNLTVKEWAINNTPGNSITAGQTH